MKTAWKRWGWPIAKAIAACALLTAIGQKFYDDLARLDRRHVEPRPLWLVASGALYFAGMLLSAWYWHHLLHVFGERPRFLTAVRAYYIGHLGKYVPGKAWALLLRGSFVRGPDTRFGVAIISSFYEVLTTMAAGALVAALVFAIDPPNVPGMDWHPLLTGLLLLALCGVPLLPGVFNFLVGRMAQRFQKVESFRLPRLRPLTLLVGLAATGAGWLLFGLGVWAMLQGVLPAPPELSVQVWMRCAGSIGLAYVAGFLILFLPGGIGAREYFLLHLLAFAGPETLIAVAVLLLRLVWTVVEVVAAALLFVIKKAPKPQGESASPGACKLPSVTPGSS
jgi:glycosyltransferase 2 family protein